MFKPKQRVVVLDGRGQGKNGIGTILRLSTETGYEGYYLVDMRDACLNIHPSRLVDEVDFWAEQKRLREALKKS